jgi:YVTN family beta-propeller protein
VEFAVLGSVTARHDDRELPLGGPKQRALLAMLLLRANEVVSRDRLIDGLWGERPPPTAGHTLDNYVSRLRKALGEARLSRRPPGYVLHVERDELDLDRFERLFQEGREALARGDAGEAAATLRSALALWRGTALADLLYEPFAASESERLEERRIMALEDRIDADLALGRSGELVPELEALVREHPLRERLLGQLMLALYRSGRQAEALAEFQAARHRLADELGLEPGPQLRELEHRILEHDPGLSARRQWLATVQRRRLRPVAVAVAVAAVATGIAVGIVVGLGETTASDVGLGASNELVEVSTSSGRTVDTLPLEGAPGAIAAAGTSLWVASPDSAFVSQVSTSSNSVVDRIPVSGQLAGIAVAGGSVWVANTVGGEVSRIDPRAGTSTQTVRLGGTLAAIASDRHELWVAEAGGKALIRIDSETGIPTRTVSLAERPSGLALGYGAVWVASYDAGTVAQIDSRSNRPLATIHVGQGPAALAVGAGSAWVANNLDGTVSRLDPGTSRVLTTIPVGSGPVALGFAEGSLWVANKFSKTVVRIDPHRNGGAVVRTVDTGGRPTSLAVTAGRLWIGTRPSGDAHRGGTLTLLGFRPDSIDPAFIQVEYPPTQFSGLTYDTLVTFERAGGPEGLQLIPDLALAVPNPTDGGRAYVFRLRPGIHYSDGRPLRASDFRRGLERLFRVGSPGAGLYTAILGSAACARNPRSCELSRGIVVDDPARRVVFRLTEPDPYLLAKLSYSFAVPVPPGTPSRDVGFRPIPGTGPYRTVRTTARETRFSRNPRFREWSYAAQPDGYPDVIVWRYGLSAEAQVRAVADGRADWMFEQIPTKLRSELERRHPAQLRVNPVLGTEFLQIDTEMPPFDDIRVRRALNYAIDRERVARLYGGASLAQPTCQIVPPGLPGYRPYCRYTFGPRRDGRWSRADAARARRLVAASGTSGARVSVWARSDEAFHASVMRYVAEVLRRLGYRPHVRVVPRGAYDEALQTGRVPLKPVTWYGGDLGASDFLRTWFACDGGETGGRFCDPRLDRLMRRAAELEATDARRAAIVWADVDRRVEDAAAAVALVTPRAVEFVSARVRNYQNHPIGGLIVDQVWLR